MTQSFTLKTIPLAATLAAALFMGGAVHAQGGGAPGAAASSVESGGAPMPGKTGAEVGESKSAVTKPTMAKKEKAQKPATAKSTMPQPVIQPGQKGDPSGVKP